MPSFRQFFKSGFDNLFLLAFGGCVVVLGASAVLGLPQRITRGNQGQNAIQALDAMRRPFLEVKRVEFHLLNVLGTHKSREDLALALASARQSLADYKQLAAYNPELSARVEALSGAFERWAHEEERLSETLAGDNAGAEALHRTPLLVSVANSFLETMNCLGDGEAPIHADIAAGEAGNRLLAGLFAGLLLYFVLLALAKQRRMSLREEAFSLERVRLDRDAMEATQRALADAEQERAKFSAIVSAINLGIHMLDRDHRLLFQNDFARSALGPHLGEQCFRALRGLDAPCAGCPVASAVAERRIHRTERWDTVDGTPRHLEITASPILDVHGRVVAALECIRDTTKQKREQEQLHAAKEAAEAASKAKGRFLANVSHELRTPLHAVLGYTELVLDGIDGPLNEDQSRSLANVERNARHLLRMIDEILDLSKLETTKVELACVPFGLREILGDITETLRVLALQKDLQLSLTVPPDLQDGLLGDPDRLRQILLNLGMNAIKFTPRGEVSLDVRTHGEPRDDLGLHFSVSDTGIGIPRDKQEKIFEAFFQVDGSSTRANGGTGLGLAISSTLAKMMGGHLWVESEEGQGSTFHFIAGFQAQGPKHLQLELPVMEPHQASDSTLTGTRPSRF